MPNSAAGFAGICILLLCIFHIAFVCCRRPPRTFWIIVDWIWISMASFALISGTFEIRKNRTEDRIEILKNLFDASKTNVENILQIEAFNSEKIPDLSDTYEWATRLGSELRFADTAKDNWEFFSDIWIPVLIKNEFVLKDDPKESQHLANLKSKTLNDLRELLSISKELVALQSTAHRTTFERGVLLFLPWVLTIAIALRLTKVTAEYEPWKNKLIAFSAASVNLTGRSISKLSRFLTRISKKRKR
jgi:hypothetical protein